MTFMDIVMNYVVPIVAGVFFLIFASIFIYIIHRAVLKPLKVYDYVNLAILSYKRKKLLQDETLIEYCVIRVGRGWKESQVREELLLANKYTAKRINEFIYVFNIIKKEMQSPEEKKKKVAEDLP